MDESDCVSYQYILVCQLPKLLDDVIPECEVEHVEAAVVHFQPVDQLELPDKPVDHVITRRQGPGCILPPSQQA